MSIKFLEPYLQRGSPLIIAEIGANYGGMDVVRAMVRGAAACGVDMVKFQTYRAETIAAPDSFFTFEDGSRVSQFDFFKKYELSKQHHEQLNTLCQELGLRWTSTPSHISDLDLLERFDLPCYKTGSDDITNLPFLRDIAAKGRPMLVSTGMCTMQEIEAAVEAITAVGNNQLILLHCVVSYPSRPEDANLNVIKTLQEKFGFPVGLSDHTPNEFTSVLATQMGAVVIEKHFTLDHALKLPDHEASLDPTEFSKLVERVRLVSQALGDGQKRILPTEEKWREAARKSIFSLGQISRGKVIQPEDMVLRRPSSGLHPHLLDQIVGKVAIQDIPPNTPITWDMLSRDN
ncbi:MAG TPA: N-acetylneuraminate synthase family protein [Methylophilaceae bacterium]